MMLRNNSSCNKRWRPKRFWWTWHFQGYPTAQLGVVVAEEVGSYLESVWLHPVHDPFGDLESWKLIMQQVWAINCPVRSWGCCWPQVNWEVGLIWVGDGHVDLYLSTTIAYYVVIIHHFALLSWSIRFLHLLERQGHLLLIRSKSSWS